MLASLASLCAFFISCAFCCSWGICMPPHAAPLRDSLTKKPSSSSSPSPPSASSRKLAKRDQFSEKSAHRPRPDLPPSCVSRPSASVPTQQVNLFNSWRPVGSPALSQVRFLNHPGKMLASGVSDQKERAQLILLGLVITEAQGELLLCMTAGRHNNVRTPPRVP